MVDHNVLVVVAAVEDPAGVVSPVRGGHRGGERALVGEVLHHRHHVVVGQRLPAHRHHGHLRPDMSAMIDYDRIGE